MRKLSVLNMLITVLFIALMIHTAHAQNKTTKIGLLLTDLNLERWSKDRDYFLNISKEFGLETMVADAKNSQQLQSQQADSMIKAGAKALVVVPVNGNEAAALVENAHKYGVKVIAYDRLIMNCDLDAYVSYDNDLIGRIMAIYTTIKVNKGNIVYVGGPKSDMNSAGIKKGLMDELEPYTKNGSLKLVCDTFVTNWSSTEAKKMIEEFLSKNKYPEIIYVANDEMAGGIIEVLDEKGLAGKVIVTGQDADLKACRNIVEGKQALTIFKPIRLLADRAAQLTLGLLGEQPFLTIVEINNGKINVPSLILAPVPIDKNNLETTVIREGYHTKEDIYKTGK